MESNFVCSLVKKPSKSFLAFDPNIKWLEMKLKDLFTLFASTIYNKLEMIEL